MNATQVIERARDLGIHLRVEGDLLKYAPKSRAPEDFVESLKQHKQELRTLLLNPRVVDAPFKWHAEEVGRRVKEEGIAIFYSGVFGDIIAFVLGGACIKDVPSYIKVIFTLQELEELYPDGTVLISQWQLKMIYEAKRRGGARVIDVQGSKDNGKNGGA